MHFCPMCGHNVAADQPVRLGEWMISPTMVARAGRRIHISPAQNVILHTIASARGDYVRTEALANRAECTDDSVAVLVHRLRRNLPDVPIESAIARGYRWTGGAV